MDKNKDSKYDGSYEQIAKIIYAYTTNKKESMIAFYKTVVMNYLLKNGDAHLKNFGLLFDDDFKNIFYSPVYDVVNTVVYIYKDKPALMLEGKKIWHSKDTLILGTNQATKPVTSTGSGRTRFRPTRQTYSDRSISRPMG